MTNRLDQTAQDSGGQEQGHQTLVTMRPTPLKERSLAPDLARGVMLLLIAMAHAPYFLYTAPIGTIGIHPVIGSLADRLAQGFTLMAVDARVYTMFGFLFAYGIGQMYARQTAKGTSPADARRLLRRRHWWMIAFGAVHAALLWQGDIIGSYGLIGLIMVPLFFGRTDRTLKIWIGVLLALTAVLGLVGALASTVTTGQPATNPQDIQLLSIAEPHYLISVLERLPAWIAVLIGSLVGVSLPAAFLMGVLASRHRILDNPGEHLVLLRRLAVGGIAAGWATGAALALQHTGVIDIAPDAVVQHISLFAGTFTGIGYAALFGLIAHRMSRRSAPPSGPVRWVSALGRRSMSGYLVQSLAWGPVLAAWGLGLGAQLSSWSVLAYAVAVWAATVVLAVVMERRGLRGPAELALRKLTYRGSAAPKPAPMGNP